MASSSLKKSPGTADVVGDPWVLVILREVFLGTSRFDAFERRLGIARNTLAQRLGRLVEEGILQKVAYQEQPERFDYRLTESGRDLYAVLAAMLAWGDRWRAPDGPPMVLTHESCGHDTSGVVVCEHCREPLVPENTAMRFAGSTGAR
ncbi:MAG TPA: helix-turn-helix domain-containing protein [Nocardioides sp.]|nr:helix-turn-helix domain-containing protein [Nocardioides sp.]